jgi:hypothetical protein
MKNLKMKLQDKDSDKNADLLLLQANFQKKLQLVLILD